MAEKPESVGADCTVVNQMREKATLWSASYRKDSKRRHLDKMNRDLGNLITPEMVSTFEKSEAARMAIAYIEQSSDPDALLEVNQSVYTLVRDFILLEITIANAHRSGVLSNMTVGEYKAAKKAKGSMIICVKSHKTADTHGPACVVLSPTLFSYLQIYVNKVRSQVEKTDDTTDSKKRDEANVFLSWTGAKLESGQISTAINAAWQKGGMQGHVTSTLFRKSAVTNVHSRHKEMKSNLADLMAHKESTAQRFYRLQEKQEACLQAATNLPSIMRISETRKDTSAPDAIQDDVIAEIDDNSPYTKADVSTGRISWKEAEVKALREVFAQNIRSKSVTMAIVRQKIQGNPTLQSLDPKRVCDRIRSEWRFNDNDGRANTSKAAESSPLPELPSQVETLENKMARYFSGDNSSVSIVPPTNSSYFSRNIFSDQSRDYLLKVCGHMVRGGGISQTAVKQALSKNEEGREMLREFTIKQLINRLKYERRMNRQHNST